MSLRWLPTGVMAVLLSTLEIATAVTPQVFSEPGWQHSPPAPPPPPSSSAMAFDAKQSVALVVIAAASMAMTKHGRRALNAALQYLLRSKRRYFPAAPGLRPRQKKVLIVGETGAGKTCLVNLLRGLGSAAWRWQGADTTEAIIELRQLGASGGATSKINQCFVEVERCQLLLIDTPGFPGDRGTPAEGQEDLAHSRLIAEAVTNAEGLHCVLLVLNGTQARLHPSVGLTLKTIGKFMPPEVLQKTIVVFTYVDSPQRRAFSIEQLQPVFADVTPPLVHLENPMSLLTSMSESDLRAKLDGDDVESKEEFKREIKKGFRAATDLVSKIRRLLD